MTKFGDNFIAADFREVLDFFRELADDKTLLKDILLNFEYYDGGGFFEKPLQRFTFNKKDSTLVVSGSQLVEILTRNKIPVERVRERLHCFGKILRRTPPIGFAGTYDKVWR